MTFDEYVSANGVQRRFDEGAHVFRQHDRCRSLFIVRIGLLKAYYLDESGRETIKSFIREGDVIASLSAAYKGEPSSFSLCCLSDAQLVELDFAALYEASQSDLDIAGATSKFLLGFAMKKERREMAFLTATAEQRYRQLVEEAPDLLERVTQKDIAKYLGITPVALSRIRGRMQGQA